MPSGILRPGGPSAKSVGRTGGKSVFPGTVGVRHIVDKVQVQRRFSVLDYPMSPRGLASALHRHHNEDEYSRIIEGRVGALLGDEVLYGRWRLHFHATRPMAYILERRR